MFLGREEHCREVSSSLIGERKSMRVKNTWTPRKSIKTIPFHLPAKVSFAKNLPV